MHSFTRDSASSCAVAPVASCPQQCSDFCGKRGSSQCWGGRTKGIPAPARPAVVGQGTGDRGVAQHHGSCAGSAGGVGRGCMYVCRCVFMSVHMCVCMGVPACVCACMYVCAWIRMGMYECVCTYIWLCMYLYMYAYVCTYMCICRQVRVCQHLYVFTSMCVRMCL